MPYSDGKYLQKSNMGIAGRDERMARPMAARHHFIMPLHGHSSFDTRHEPQKGYFSYCARRRGQVTIRGLVIYNRRGQKL